MSFLTPLYLAGLAAISLPILFHMFRRVPRGRFVFSTLMFLSPSPPRVTRRSRIEHWLLLLLRAAAVLLLAFAFARPYWRDDTAEDDWSSRPRQVAILLDTSASMRRGNLWQDAQGEVNLVLSSLNPSDVVRFHAFDDTLRTLITAEDWSSLAFAERGALALRQLQELQPTWSATRLDSALTSVAESLAAEDLVSGENAEATGERVIVLITDLQGGTRLTGIQGFEWPEQVRVDLRRVHAKDATNAFMTWIDPAQDALLEEGEHEDNRRVRVRVANSGDATHGQFRIYWQAKDGNDETAEKVDIYVPPGGSRVVMTPPPPEADATSELQLEGDGHGFDNTIFRVASRLREQSVVYLGAKSASSDGPEFFLSRALPKSTTQQTSMIAHNPGEPLPPDLATSPDLIVVTEPVEPHWIDWLRDQVGGGETTALFVVSNPRVIESLKELIDQASLSGEEAVVRDYAMLASVDFDHPLFAPFRDPQFADFTKIRFWKHRSLGWASVPGASVLARFDDGDPALAEFPLGQGSIFVLTSGWDLEDSQLGLSSKFVPLIAGMISYRKSRISQTQTFSVNEFIPLAEMFDGDASEFADASVISPAGNRMELAENGSLRVNLPGIYRAHVPNKDEIQLAVNLAASESQTEPLAPDDLSRLGVRLADEPSTSGHRQSAGQRRQLLAAELEGKQKLWQPLCLAAFLVLVFETWLAGHLARRNAAPDGATT